MKTVGHPQTCVYPDVCLGIAHVSGKALSRDKGSGGYTMYLPLSPQGICRAKRGRYIVYLPDPLSRERDFTRYMGNP